MEICWTQGLAAAETACKLQRACSQCMVIILENNKVTTDFPTILVKHYSSLILYGLQQQQFSIPIEISFSLSPPNQMTNDKPLQCPSLYRVIATLKSSVSFWQSTNKKLQCTAWGALPEVFSCPLEAHLRLGYLCPSGDFGRQSSQKHGKEFSLPKVEP